MVKEERNPFSKAISHALNERERLKALDLQLAEEKRLKEKAEAAKKAELKAKAEAEAKVKFARQLAEAKPRLIGDIQQAISLIPPRELDDEGSISFSSTAMDWFYHEGDSLTFVPVNLIEADTIILERDKRLRREGSSSTDSSLQISLLWNNYNDLDLHVTCPSGERIHGGNKKSACGGELDVDANVRAETRKPVENVFWEEGKAPAGTYQVYVHHYKKHQKRKSKDPTKFQVIVQTTSKVWEYSGEISSGEPMQLVGEFSFQDGMFTLLNVHYNEGDFTEYRIFGVIPKARVLWRIGRYRQSYSQIPK